MSDAAGGKPVSHARIAAGPPLGMAGGSESGAGGASGFGTARGSGTGPGDGPGSGAADVPIPQVIERGPPVTLAITGASGAPYAVRLLEELVRARIPVRLVVSETGWRLLREEAAIEDEAGLIARTGGRGDVVVFDDADRGATPASGSAPSRGTVVCPCSMGTLASIAQGTTRSLIERAADVTLKEHRPLVLVPRETPYSIIHLENMLRLARAGAVVLPASPGFYHRPQTIDDLIDFVVGRALAHIGIESALGPRWRSGEGD